MVNRLMQFKLQHPITVWQHQFALYFGFIIRSPHRALIKNRTVFRIKSGVNHAHIEILFHDADLDQFLEIGG
ncbi:Uncharacterised protein [Vibrio cholerae]|nr:Uncharacterised protein [Vibrio cholerae]CSA42849.1 Uncharacterised protein [Vibrio cholerae]CSC66857.1 Uncharacterised protein [Vibrio cholerae]